MFFTIFITHLSRTIGRAIIHQNYLIVIITLVKNRLDTFIKILCRVVYWYNIRKRSWILSPINAGLSYAFIDIRYYNISNTITTFLLFSIAAISVQSISSTNDNSGTFIRNAMYSSDG